MAFQHRVFARRVRRQHDPVDPGAPLSGSSGGPGANGGSGTNGGPGASGGIGSSSGGAGSGSGGSGSGSDGGLSSTVSAPSPPTSSPAPQSSPSNNNNQVPSATARNTFLLATSTSNIPDSTSASQSTSTTSSSAPPITTENTSSTSTDTSSAADSPTISLSSSSSIADTTSSTTTSTVILTAPAVIVTSSVGVSSHSSLTIGTLSVTHSATASAAPSGGVNVGTVVGGIIGTLVGLAVIGIVASFVLRRMRKRNRRDTIIIDDDDEFGNSQFAPAGDTGIRGNDIFEPPNMVESRQSFAPSVNSGPGMAGHGAFQGGAAYNSNAATGYGAGTTGVVPNRILQERPKYTYGQQNEEEVDEAAHGIYSSQPQPQVSYNPEVYSSYAAYNGHTTGYQEVTREYQGQQQDDYSANPGYGVAVADPGPSASSGAHPSSSRDQATLTGNRGQNTHSVAVQDDDVYGGI